MDRYSTRYLNRSGLTIAATIVLVGIIELIKAFRKHDRGEEIVVAVIFFILMPEFVLWARRLPSTDRKAEGNSPGSRHDE